MWIGLGSRQNVPLSCYFGNLQEMFFSKIQIFFSFVFDTDLRRHFSFECVRFVIGEFFVIIK